MKLICDICGGALQMNPNNTGACCTNCGMNYSVESLRNKLNGRANIPPHQTQNPSPAAPQSNPNQNPQNGAGQVPFNGIPYAGANPNPQNTPPYAGSATFQGATKSVPARALILEMKPGGIVAKQYGIVVMVDGVAQPMITQKSGALVIPVGLGEHVISAEIKSGGQRTDFVVEPMRFYVTAHNWYGLFSFHRGAWKAYFKLDLLEDVEGRTNDVRF